MPSYGASRMEADPDRGDTSVLSCGRHQKQRTRMESHISLPADSGSTRGRISSKSEPIVPEGCICDGIDNAFAVQIYGTFISARKLCHQHVLERGMKQVTSRSNLLVGVAAVRRFKERVFANRVSSLGGKLARSICPSCRGVLV